MSLERDGEPLLAWQLEGMTIHSTSPFDGRSLKVNEAQERPPRGGGRSYGRAKM